MRTKIESCLNQAVPTKKLPYFLAAVLFFNAVYFSFIALFFDVSDNYAIYGRILDISAFSLVSFIIVSSLLEEITFRLIPLFAAMALKEKLGQNQTHLKKYAVLYAAMLSSLAFGAFSGAITGNASNLLTEGVNGLILSFIFLKCGGYQKKYLKATIISTLAHASFSILAFALYL